MSQTPSKPGSPYNFDPAFERAIVTLACSQKSFFGKIAHELDPALLGTDNTKRALEAAKVIYRELGHGPDSLLIVAQRLRARVHSGAITLEQALETCALFDASIDAGLPSEETVINELRPILQKRMNEAAVRSAIDEFGKGGDLSGAQKLIARSARIGVHDVSLGTKFGDAGFQAIEELRKMERLPTGIDELDLQLDGGLQRGGLGVVIAGSGVGKSQGLSHFGGHALRRSAFVCLATLELPEATQHARLVASVTGIPINEMLFGDMSRAKKRVAGMQLGRCLVREFSPYSTTIEDLFEWVRLCEEEAEQEIDLLLVDYADLLGAPKTSKGDQSTYETGRIVYGGLREYADRRKKWVWTASQANRSKDSHKRVDASDVADSLHKVRVADLVLTLTPKGDECEELLIYVAKHRTGRSRFQIGPLPTSFECGRLVTIVE